MTTEIDIREFDTAEEAIEYLSSADADEVRVGVRSATRPEGHDVEEAELFRRNPDLPVIPGDRTHQVLWLLNEYGDRTTGFTNTELVVLSDDDTLIKSRPSPATNALYQAGYVSRTSTAPYVNCITEKGQEALEKHLGNPETEEVFIEDLDPRSVHDIGKDALEADWDE